jgi:hypothetical protein
MVNKKPDIFILDRNKKEIIIMGVGITSFDNLRTVEVEKNHKYDLLANHTGSLYKYKTRIIPYVMTWDGVVTKFHKQYRHEIGLDNRIQSAQDAPRKLDHGKLQKMPNVCREHRRG